MGWFPCSGKSTEKPPRKKKSGQQDDPFTPSSTTTSTPTSTFTSTSSSDKMKAIPSMNGKKEVNSPSNVRKEVNPPLNVKTGVHSPMRAKRDVNSPMSAKRDVNSPMSAKRDVNSPMSAKRDVNSPMSAKREVNSPASARKEVNSPFSVRKEVTPQMNMKNETYPLLDMKNEMDPELNMMKEDHKDIAPAHAAVGTFTFQQLEAATKNFREDCLLGEGGFGRVYKGKMEGSNQVVAIKQLDRNGLQGNKEFLVEVLMLSLVHHPNLVNLLGYCADGDQRLLVYEYMPLGSLEDHLHDLHPSKKPLDWNARMKIAAGAAKGLEYLHDIAKPPVIYRDLKCSNILLGEEYYPKLSDFGLAKLGPIGDKTHVSTRVMGTYGYCAPEYAMTGQLTLKSDIYSFGVVLLEIITGRKAIDNSKPTAEQNLVAWARPLFKDRKKFSQMVDPKLKCMYPMRGLYQALAVAAMCVQEQSSLRPAIADVVTALSYLASQIYKPEEPSVQSTDTTLSMQRSGMAPLTPPRPKRVNTRYIKAPTNPVNLIDQCNS